MLPTIKPTTNCGVWVTAAQAMNVAISSQSVHVPICCWIRPTRSLPVHVPESVRLSDAARAIVRPSFAEVEPANLVTRQEFRCWTFQPVASVRQDVASIADRQRLAGTLLDHQHGRPAPVDLH